MKHILLTNDDGLATEGLKSLCTELARFGKITVVAPLYEQSAASHSITIFQPLFFNTVKVAHYRMPFYAVRGTPVDCVKLAFSRILKRRPDLMIAGINLGANVGLDTFYSGTVAAAFEAAFWQVNAFAISVEQPSRGCPDFKSISKLGVKLVKSILATTPHPGVVFNINIPCRPLNRIRGVKYTRQCLTTVKDEFIRGRDSRGRNYYWIKSGTESMRDEKRTMRLRNQLPQVVSDLRALRDGYISITPLKPDFSDYQILANPPRVSIL